MKNCKQFILAPLLFLTCTAAISQETIVWSGWMDFGSCNRTKTYKDDFGNEWPTNESVGQTLNGEIFLVGTVQDWVMNRVKTCAETGIAAAGAAAFLTDGAAVWPTFTASFNACIADTGITNVAAENLGYRIDTHCNW